MVFSSNLFIFIFLPLCVMLYYLLFRRNIKAGNYLLLVASLLFYAWGEPKFVLVMIGSIILNYLFGLGIWKYPKLKKPILVFAAILNLSLLFVYKYLGFTLDNLSQLFGYSFSVNIALPIGISFFTFQAMSYVIDVYRGTVNVQKNPLYVALYISFFPQLIAGPIVRYVDIERQIDSRTHSLDKFSDGLRRFTMGLAKKVVISNSLAFVADKSFGQNSAGSSFVGLWLGAFAFAFQIFFDFSGYSDMAIGIAKMFGFELKENFNFPYISKSVSEFWRRWHISLGSWFRDYIYFPLGGSRVKSRLRLVFNLAIVWTLTGVWHGASWNFVVWGILFFVFIAFEKLTGIPGRLKSPITRALYRVVSMLAVLLGWVIFKSESLTYAVSYIAQMFTSAGRFCDDTTALLLTQYIFYFVIAVLLSMPIAKAIKGIKIKGRALSERKWFGVVCDISLALLFLLSVSYINTSELNPFIYFNF